MGMIPEKNGLAAALFGKTRREILALLFTHADDAFYLRQIIRATGTGTGAAQREVRNLADAGVITREVRGNQVYYQANPACPVFSELKSLMIKTAGVADVLGAALAPLAGRIRTAFVYGSFAGGRERRASDVDIMVIGEAGFGEVVSSLTEAQRTLAREVNPTVYRPAEFRKKLKTRKHFLKSVLSEPKIFLIGSDDELKRLAERRLAD